MNSMISSVQFSSVAQSCLSLCNPMNRSTPGLPVHHHLPEFTLKGPASKYFQLSGCTRSSIITTELFHCCVKAEKIHIQMRMTVLQ